MTKFFDKKLEDELGIGAAVQVAGIATELSGYIEMRNAVRAAEGRPSIQEEADEAIAYMEKMFETGQLNRADYPDLFGDEDDGHAADSKSSPG